MNPTVTGVLLMAHGTPSSMDELPEYLKFVRGGRPPSPELVAQMRHHYEAIGGRSPLTEITMAQAGAVRARLGAGVPVAVGMRNWRPFIGDAIAELTGAGVTRIIGIPLTPQFSTLSVQKYHDAAAAAVPPGVQFEGVRSFYSHPLLLQAFAERIGDTPPQAGDALVFTAHSLPVRVIQAGDRYAEEVAVTAHGVAERIGCAHYTVAYQSAGRTNEPWMGPELGQVIGELAARGRSSVLVVPIGFVCDHTEILFDIDVEAAAVARDRGMTLRRTESLNASPTFIAMLEDVIRGFL